MYLRLSHVAAYTLTLSLVAAIGAGCCTLGKTREEVRLFHDEPYLVVWTPRTSFIPVVKNGWSHRLMFSRTSLYVASVVPLSNGGVLAVHDSTGHGRILFYDPAMTSETRFTRLETFGNVGIRLVRSADSEEVAWCRNERGEARVTVFSADRTSRLIEVPQAAARVVSLSRKVMILATEGVPPRYFAVDRNTAEGTRLSSRDFVIQTVGGRYWYTLDAVYAESDSGTLTFRVGGAINELAPFEPGYLLARSPAEGKNSSLISVIDLNSKTVTAVKVERTGSLSAVSGVVPYSLVEQLLRDESQLAVALGLERASD
ncbi:MAG: hypothetical protein DYH07_13245 [Armatimonadetes bacterium ATM1]|nr:hypothetical protein [Armatimonadetes bacterium ATM1]